MAAMTGDLRASHVRRRPSWRRSWRPSIRVRVLAIVLIPSAALIITGVSVAGYLIHEGLLARDFASTFAQGSGQIVQVTSALEQERTISLRALAGDRQALAGLQAQWDTTNAALSQALSAGNAVKDSNPQVVAGAADTARELSAQLALLRQKVRTGRASVTEVDAFYTQAADVGATVQLRAVPGAPSAAAAADDITALDLFEVPDLHSRTVGLGAGWQARGVLSQPDRLVLAQLTGAYRNQLEAIVPRLPRSAQAAYAQLVAGKAWRLATSGEDDLALHGRLAVPVGSWLTAEDTVSAGLLGLWADGLRHAQAEAAAAADRTVSRSVLLGSLVLALAIAAFAAALVLANALVRRLQRLRAKTLELADVTLPSIIRRISEGKRVDLESEMELLDYGSDEVGQVAGAFNTAQRTAVTAAAAEARTRGGISNVFLDIAHRSQLVVHRQLEVLDAAEARQSDPEHLELLFQLDHLATRARRNAENLLILGGGQPGRRWRQPAALEDIVRSAVSETEHFARVRTVRLPDVQVQGSVVGDLIHLLAELIDNATAFSPPDSAVTVHGNLVGKGAVVEVEDQGLGIEFAERERLNQTLANPPGFQEMALSGQRHLGLFVVGQLAQRHGIAVRLLESAYGGAKAIVLIPSSVSEADGVAGGGLPPIVGSGRHERLQMVPAGVALATGPQPHGTEDAAQWERPAAEPLTEPAHQLLSRRGRQASAASLAPWDLLPGSGDPAPEPARRSRVPLPRRERLASLAPELQQDAEAPHSTAPKRLRSPDEARGSMSALQRGTRLGRGVRGEGER